MANGYCDGKGHIIIAIEQKTAHSVVKWLWWMKLLFFTQFCFFSLLYSINYYYFTHIRRHKWMHQLAYERVINVIVGELIHFSFLFSFSNHFLFGVFCMCAGALCLPLSTFQTSNIFDCYSFCFVAINFCETTTQKLFLEKWIIWLRWTKVNWFFFSFFSGCWFLSVNFWALFIKFERRIRSDNYVQAKQVEE